LSRKPLGGAVALLFALPLLAAVAFPTALAEPVVAGLDVSSAVTLADTSFILTDNITVRAGGRLTLDNVSVQFRLDVDNSLEIRVKPGGELHVVNGTRIYAQFQSPAYALHYRVFIEQGGRFVFQNSTIDYAYWVGVGDESAVIEDSTISHALMGLFGWNLTVSRLTIFSSNVGMWLSGHSLVRDSTFEISTVYGAILDGTSAVENSSFTGSETADLALLDSAQARNTTHRSSVRGAILYGNASMHGAAMDNMTTSGIQVGEEDFRYGCGIFVQPANPTTWPNPMADWLNLHLFTYYHRVDNNITLSDITIRNTPKAIEFARDVWRMANDAPVMDNCQSDPPYAPGPGRPLENRVDLSITRPTEFAALASEFNGSLTIDAGGALTLRGVAWKFISPGSPHQIDINGGSLVLDGASFSTALVDYAADALNETPSATPNMDIMLRAGAVIVRGSTLSDLGTSADPAVDAGLVVADGAGPVTISGTAVENSARGVSMGCCGAAAGPSTRVTLEDSSFATGGPSVVLRGGNLTAVNSSLSSTASTGVLAVGAEGDIHLMGSSTTLQGPGNAAIFRYGFVEARAVWEDLRPAGGAVINVTDFATGAPVAALPTGADGWATPGFLLYRTTAWDGLSEQGEAPRLFLFSAAAGGAAATSLPVDVSGGATVTLAIPDERPPVVALNLPAEYYANVSGGFVTGVAQDFETGVTVVEMSLDGGPFLSVTTPSAPRLGSVPFSFTLSGLAEGVHVVAVRVWDSVGNTAETSSYFIVDLHFPQVSDFPFDLVTNQRSLTVSGKLNEPGTVTIKGNTTNASTVDGSFTLPLYLDLDSEYIVVSVVDLAGNSHDYPFVARLDQAPPQLEITSPANGTFTTQPRALVSGVMEFNSVLSLNGVPLSVSGTTSFSITAALSEGENLLVLSAEDRAGNRRSVALVIFYDSNPPPLDILGPDASRTLGSPNATLVLRTEAGVIVQVGNFTMTAAGAIVEIPLRLNEGRNLLSVSVSDLAGNSVLRGLALTVDTVSPTISFTLGDNVTTQNATYFLTGLTERGALVTVGGYAVFADGQGSFAVPIHLAAGQNVVEVVARDSAGNVGSGTLRVFVSEPTLAQPPGLAAPAGGAALLLVLGLAACGAAPLLARALAKRRG